MADTAPTSLAQSIYPDMQGDKATTPPTAQPTNDTAQKLFGNPPSNKLVDGKSSLGGQAKPSATVLGQGDPKAPPVERPADAPFNPEMVKIEGMQSDPALMGEFSTAAKELGLGHAGAERLLQLHAKTRREADAAMSRQSDAWQEETLAALPQHDIQLVTGLVRDPNLTDPALREWLESSPAGNWLPLVRSLANWARAIRR
jgi:hypothetical protein